VGESFDENSAELDHARFLALKHCAQRGLVESHLQSLGALLGGEHRWAATRDPRDVHPSGREQDHLRPPPGDDGPGASPNDPTQAVALVVRGLPYLNQLGLGTSSRTEPMEGSLPSRGVRSWPGARSPGKVFRELC